MTSTTPLRSEISPGTWGHWAGPSDAPPLVLLHGVGLALEAWEPQLASLSRHYRVLALDLPGHGQSDELPTDATLGDYVGWLARVLASAFDAPVSLAGHSMGALIALGAAVEHPALLRRVALLNAVHRRDEAARAAVLARAEQIRAGDIDPSAPLARWFQPSEHAGAAYRLTASLLARARLGGYATAYRAFADGDRAYAERLHEVSCPLLALTGDGDANSTAAMSRALAAAAPHGRAQVVHGHRHMLNLTAPDAVDAALQQWMENDP